MHRGMLALGPVQIDPAVGLVLVFGQRLAVDGMDHHPLAAGR